MIYICVPSHDEGQTIGVVLWKVRQVMADANRDYQVLVADDGSTDKTPAVLEPYTRVLPLTVMRSDAPRGYAASLEMLLREAVHRSEYPRRDAVVVLQADFTEEPEHITALLKRIESGADVVVSNATGRAGGPLRARLARAAERLVLRRKAWPSELRDPLLGFHAYRVSSLRRAFEVDTARRLLRWEGRVANAALLEAVLPHARRVDAVDLPERAERRQRPSRYDAGGRLRQVWAYARSREVPDLLPVAALAPSEVRTARTAEHEVSARALREAGVTRPGEEERPRRRRSGGSRNGKGRPGVKEGHRSRRTGEDGGRKRRSAEDATADGEPKRRRRRKPRAEAGAEDSASSAAPESGEPRKRRSRRGRRRRPDEGVEAQGSTAEAEAEAASDEAQAAADDAVPEAGDGAGEDGGTRPRRRRGRRGGRRRSGRSRPEDGAETGGETTPPGPPSEER